MEMDEHVVMGFEHPISGESRFIEKSIPIAAWIGVQVYRMSFFVKQILYHIL